jgi:hypothetical protein
MLAGSAVLGNVKAVMLVAPLLDWVLFRSRPLRRTSVAAWLKRAHPRGQYPAEDRR